MSLLKGWSAIYYREALILWLRRRRYAASMAVAPLLYLTAFSYAVGDSFKVEDWTYTEFLIPGLVAMASMLQAYSISAEINIARFYWKIFEEFQAAPISETAYVVGEVAGGVTRAMVSVIIIVLMGLLFGVSELFRVRLHRRLRGHARAQPRRSQPSIKFHNYAHGVSGRHILSH